jgi:hypothetical protein
MKLVLLLPLFFLISCASGPERDIASDEIIVLGEVDGQISKVKMYSSSGHPDLHHFYLELRNSSRELVDVELRDIRIKEGRKHLSTLVRRISLGRYEIEVDQQDLNFKALKFSIQDKPLKHRLVRLKKPVRENSSIVVILNENNRLKGQLILKDKNGAVFDVPHSPEIIFVGRGEASVPVKLKTGVWEFEITYPEDNQILYLSVRANGVLLEKLFRYQHVEK